jgi:hypothetical protein
VEACMCDSMLMEVEAGVARRWLEEAGA